MPPPVLLLPLIRLRARSGDLPHAFVDDRGRERLFHGTNAVTKGPPWVPDHRAFSGDISMAAEDFAVMQRLGLNVVRLGVMWPGVEPRRGAYNATYLDEIDRVVQLAAQHGVYTLLDMHQDGLSELYCGEGLPVWAVRSDTGRHIVPEKAFPAPFSTFDPRSDFYNEPKLAGAPRIPTRLACSTHNLGPGWHEATMASADSYQAFWENVDGIGDQWAAMWAHVARRFAGRPEVLGLELINEPFAGDFYQHPGIMIPRPSPGNADRVNLQPAYDRVAAAVRQADPDRLIFFAGVTWGDTGAGFSAAPGGD